MNIAEDLLHSTTLVLPPDAVMERGSELPTSLQDRMSLQEGDYLVSRAGLSAPTSVIDEAAANFLREFRQPCSLVEAVIRHARRAGDEPEQVLEESVELIRHLLRSGILARHASPQSAPLAPLLSRGHKVGEFEVLACIKVSDIAEIYQATTGGTLAAIKIGRPGAPAAMPQLMDNELRILEHLDGTAAPRLLAIGDFEGRPYFVTQWIAGTTVSQVAQTLMERATVDSYSEFAELCHRCANTYARLHERGVVHGDVHAGNLLIDNTWQPWLLDFGLAQVADEPAISIGRGGVAAFFEPEYARAILQERPVPAATLLGEQFALAALLRSLLTGAHYVDFSLEREEMFQQIAFDLPRPFSQQGMACWPEAEPVLGHALTKEPMGRYTGMEALAEDLRAAADERLDRLRGRVVTNANTFLPGKANASFSIKHSFTRALVDTFRLDHDVTNQAVPQAPTSSLSHGAAGIAYGLWQLSCRWQDSSLLSLANVWATRAANQSNDRWAFRTEGEGLSPEVVGEVSPFHTESGVHCVRAFIARSMCDVRAQRAAVEMFVATSARSCQNLDLTLGWSGCLLACSLMMEAADNDVAMVRLLRAHGDAVFSRIWTELEASTALADGPAIRHLGVAHGWAGIVYAAMRWCRTIQTAIPAAVQQRLLQLSKLAEPDGRGARWPWLIVGNDRASEKIYMPGWCNGTAGFAHVWALAYEILREPRYLQLAEQSAWHAFAAPGSHVGLCCGLAGRAYAQLAVYKLTQDTKWLEHARSLARLGHVAALELRQSEIRNDSALEQRPYSLYKGSLGLALLLEDLACPKESRLPFFEPHGWSLAGGNPG